MLWMMSKRQFVLYGAGATLLVVVAVVLIVRGGNSVSDMPTAAETANPFEPVATTSQIRDTSDAPTTPAAPAPEPFRFEVVTDQRLQAKGLSGRATIPPNYGMLFVFAEKDKHGFWMKDMLASIDIIWISDEKVVLGVEEAVSPDSYAEGTVFYPPEPVRYVLETRAGEAARLGLSPGTTVNLPLPYGE